jgi:hypothetical protein
MSRKRNIQIGIALGILIVASIIVAMAATGVGDVGNAGSTVK